MTNPPDRQISLNAAIEMVEKMRTLLVSDMDGIGGEHVVGKADVLSMLRSLPALPEREISEEDCPMCVGFGSLGTGADAKEGQCEMCGGSGKISALPPAPLDAGEPTDEEIDELTSKWTFDDLDAPTREELRNDVRTWLRSLHPVSRPSGEGK